MTDRERLAVGLALSLAVHWLVMGASLPEADGGHEVIFTADLAPPEAAVSVAAPMTLESLAPEPSVDKAARDAALRRKLARQRYLDGVIRAVHDRRLVVPTARSLAGNVLVSFVIGPDGGFSRVRLVRGSGDPAMNADALQAVRAASGVTPRPGILGRRPMPVSMAVKYQYGLE